MRKLQSQSNDDQINAALAGLNHEVDIVTVDNPLATIRGIKSDAIRSLRKDPLAALHARGQLGERDRFGNDTGEARYHAGRLWQRYYEQLEIGGSRAIDPTKEAVDGGRFPEPDLDKREKASKALRLANQKLGYQGKVILQMVLGEHKTIQEMSMGLGLTSKREFEYMGQRFRECLETLAKLWGFA